MTRPQEENGTTTADRQRKGGSSYARCSGITALVLESDHDRGHLTSLDERWDPAGRRLGRAGPSRPADGRVLRGIKDAGCREDWREAVRRQRVSRCTGGRCVELRQAGGHLVAVDAEGARLVGIGCACVGDDQTSEQKAATSRIDQSGGGGGGVRGPDVEREAMRLHSRRARQW